MAKTEYKYGDPIPSTVKELQTADGDLTFVKGDGKVWSVKSGSVWGMSTYENDGSLLWEWAQHNPLVAPKTKLEKAQEYFAPLSAFGIEDRLKDSRVAREYAATIIRSC